MDTKLKTLLNKEQYRQQYTLGLIPSENFSSKAVRELVGSVFMHKYSEGFVNARYYEGNEVIDELETYTKELLYKVFNVDSEQWHVNVQVPTGSIANLVVYNAVLNPGDKILGFYLPDGGHLSHGWSYTPTKDRSAEDIEKLQNSMIYEGGSEKVTLNSKIFNVIQYKTKQSDNLLDYNFIEELILKEKPQMVITGGTAYSRDIDYKRISDACKKVGSLFLTDVAHEAGLIASGLLNNPFEYADFVTFTTHKTFRGPKGAVVFSKAEYGQKIDKSVMPGLLGGPLNHTIAGIAQACTEILANEFKEYSKQIILNAKALAKELENYGFKIITGGTDKHLFLIDLSNKEILGRHVSKALAYAGIISNKSTIPYEKGSPINPTGLRLGTPLLTTRGMKEPEMQQIASMINKVVNAIKPFGNLKFDEFSTKVIELPEIKEVNKEVIDLCNKFPLDF